MSLLDLIDKLATKKPEPFVAPIPLARAVSVRTMQDGVPYTFKVPAPRPGWWRLIPDGKLARIDNPAAPSDMIDYLNQLPRFYVIALYPTGDTTWLVVPYSIADVTQRGWIDGVPREVHLVRGTVEPFDVLVARALPGVLIFDDIDTRLGNHSLTARLREALSNEGRSPTEVNWRNAWSTVRNRYEQLLKEQQEAEKLRRITEQKLTTEEAIKFQLEFMGAALRKVEPSPNGYIVDWTAPDGNTYSMRVGRNLHIEVAGLCLAGTDRQHNLASIVSVMEEAVRLRRPDLRHAMVGGTFLGDEDYDDD